MLTVTVLLYVLVIVSCPPFCRSGE